MSPDVLERYVGVYTGFWGANPRKVDVLLAGEKLVIHINDDPEELTLTPLSDKLFQTAADGLAYEFLAGDTGSATDVVEIHVSGGYQYARRK